MRFVKGLSSVKFKEIYEIMKFHLIKLPFIYLLILAGYILEFTVELPYLIVCRFGGKPWKKQ
jgi:hypothetical protein